MPFPLAHPAAVLPFRRNCPRPLNFAALVVGSVVPDIGYLFERYKWDGLAHRFAGAFTLCLPLGLLMLVFIYGLRGWLANILPQRQRLLLLPSSWQPPGNILVIVISLLLGIWTHQSWDLFTRSGSWMGEYLPVLDMRVVVIGHRQLELCHVLWYVCSFVGVACVCFAYQRRLYFANPATHPISTATIWRNALIVSALFLPIEIAHHLIHGIISAAFVATCSAVVVLGTGLKLSSDLRVQENSVAPVLENTR